jgi:hypothetical protein
MSNIISSIASAFGGSTHDKHHDGHAHDHGAITHEHEPIVQEHLTEHHEKHITPVVEKVIDQPVVHRSVEDTHEHEEHTSHTTSEAAAIPKETFDESHSNATTPTFGIEPEQTSEAVTGDTVIDEPVVHETVHERHIEEVQPVVHRNVDHHTVEHVTQPIHEEHHAGPIFVDEGQTNGIKSPFET